MKRDLERTATNKSIYGAPLVANQNLVLLYPYLKDLVSVENLRCTINGHFGLEAELLSENMHSTQRTRPKSSTNDFKKSCICVPPVIKMCTNMPFIQSTSIIKTTHGGYIIVSFVPKCYV